jgi:hypothetical protein
MPDSCHNFEGAHDKRDVTMPIISESGFFVVKSDHIRIGQEYTTQKDYERVRAWFDVPLLQALLAHSYGIFVMATKIFLAFAAWVVFDVNRKTTKAAILTCPTPHRSQLQTFPDPHPLVNPGNPPDSSAPRAKANHPCLHHINPSYIIA